MRHFIILVFLIPMLAACSTKQPTFLKIAEPQIRKNIIGLSIFPPPGDGWHYKTVSPARIEFGTLRTNEIQSLVASAVAHKIPTSESENGFLLKISEERWRDTKSNSRYKDLLIEEDISHEKESLCVRYHTKYEDHGSKYLSKQIPFFIVEDIGLICRHPENYNVGISIGISQRAEPNKLLQNFESIANAFLSGAKFETLPTE